MISEKNYEDKGFCYDYECRISEPSSGHKFQYLWGNRTRLNAIVTCGNSRYDGLHQVGARGIPIAWPIPLTNLHFNVKIECKEKKKPDMDVHDSQYYAKEWRKYGLALKYKILGGQQSSEWTSLEADILASGSLLSNNPLCLFCVDTDVVKLQLWSRVGKHADVLHYYQMFLQQV